MKLTALRAYLRDARDAFVHAPVEVLIGVCVAVTFSVSVRATGGEGEWWVRVFAAAVVALPLVFGASVLRARGVISAAARWGATALALAVAGGYAAWIFDPGRSAEGWRAAALAAAAWLALALVPIPGGGDEAERRWRFWRFDAFLLARILTVGLYGAALFAALAGAVSAVTSLFELDAPDHLYQDLAGAVFFALVPWVVAGGVPVLAAEGSDRSAVPLTAARRVGRYFYAVVLVIYLAILFAYTLKVLATGDLPKNILSPIVLIAGLGGLLGGIFLEPLHDDPESRGVGRLIRAFPALLLPLLPLPIWAVGVRQDQYGWTEFRYLRLVILLALLVLAIVGTVRLVRRQRPLLALVPALLAAALLLGSVGPWSAQAVSRRDQSARLRAGLTEAGLLKEGRLTRALLAPGQNPARPDSLPGEQYRRISGALTYLYDAHGPAAVRRVVGVEVKGYENGWQLVHALGVREGCRSGAPRFLFGHLAANTAIPVQAGTAFLISTEAIDRVGTASRAPGEILMEVQGTVVTLGMGGGRYRSELAPLLRTLAARAPGACGDQPASNTALSLADARVPLLDAAGTSRGELVVTSVSFSNMRTDSAGRAAPGPMRVERVGGMAVVRP
jgi:hypothetical protein